MQEKIWTGLQKLVIKILFYLFSIFFLSLPPSLERARKCAVQTEKSPNPCLLRGVNLVIF